MNRHEEDLRLEIRITLRDAIPLAAATPFRRGHNDPIDANVTLRLDGALLWNGPFSPLGLDALGRTIAALVTDTAERMSR